jgi:ABC-type Fe3+-hydroxamate transport system substrate-binding protein
VVALFAGQQNPFSATVLQSPLWTGIDAVKAGNVLEVDDQTWIGGIGYRAAFAVLDELATHFKV